MLLSRQRLEFWLLELDEKIVAAQFALRLGETVYQLQEGFDPGYSSDSVGYVLRGQVLRNLIDRGIRRYDFLGGEEESNDSPLGVLLASRGVSRRGCAGSPGWRRGRKALRHIRG